MPCLPPPYWRICGPGGTWSGSLPLFTGPRTIDHIDGDEVKKELQQDFYSKGTEVKDDHTRPLDKVEVYENDGQGLREDGQQAKGVVTLTEAAVQGAALLGGQHKFQRRRGMLQIQAPHIYTRVLQGVPAYREETDRLHPSSHGPVPP